MRQKIGRGVGGGVCSLGEGGVVSIFFLDKESIFYRGGYFSIN